MSEVFALVDELGPAKVIHVHNPTLGLQGNPGGGQHCDGSTASLLWLDGRRKAQAKCQVGTAMRRPAGEGVAP